MAKKKFDHRTKMSTDQVKAYLKHYAKKHDLRGKEFDEAKDKCAATRWAALERWTNAHKAKPRRAKKAAKKGHKKAA